MPSIPTIVARRSPMIGAPDTRASPEAFGAGVGRALQGLGDQMLQTVRVADSVRREYEAKSRDEQLANMVAQADITSVALEARANAPADGSGVVGATRDGLMAWLDKQSDAIVDPELRRQYRMRMLERFPGYVAQAAQFEYVQAEDNSKFQADTALNAVINRVRSDAGGFDVALQDGFAVIDARPNIPAGQKEQMKVALQGSLADARFRAMLGNAASVQEFDAIRAELADKRWTDMFQPSEYDNILAAVDASKKAFVTGQDAVARGVLDSLEARNAAHVQIPLDELQEAQQVINASGSAAVQAKFARLYQQQQDLDTFGRLPPLQLDGVIGAIKDDLVSANATPELAQWSQDASALVGGAVSAGFISTLVADHEYSPGYLTGGQNSAPLPFRWADGRQVDASDPQITGLKPGLVTTVSRALRSVGLNHIPVNSPRAGYATTGHAAHSQHYEGNAIDISWRGMGDAEKAALLKALIASGAQGIGVGQGIVHVDMGAKRTWTYSGAAAIGRASNRDGWEKNVPAWAKPIINDWMDGKIGAAAPTGANYDVRNPDTDARGLGQFDRETWIELVKNSSVLLGVDVAGKSDDEIWELAADPALNVKGIAIYAKQNYDFLLPRIGRAPEDADLYLAHLLGPSGAADFINAMKADPDAPVRATGAFSSAAIRMNEGVFFAKGGDTKTFREVYNEMATSFATGQTNVQYSRSSYLEDYNEQRRTRIGNDPMAEAAHDGVVQENNLEGPDDWARLGRDAATAASYYSIPSTDMKPFTENQAAQLAAQVAQNSADQNLALMANIQAMGGDMARAAYKQLGLTNPVWETAAGLAYDRGQMGTAGDVVRGATRLRDDPAVKDRIGATDSEISQAFADTVGNSLLLLSPRETNGVLEAAKALYVERYTARGQSWDEDGFANAVHSVLGNNQQQAVGEVNSEPTLLPPGLGADQFDAALDVMTQQDWARMSLDGKPPLYVDGSPLMPDELADEAVFRAIGGNQYAVELADGKFAMTQSDPQMGRLRRYIFVADPARLRQLAEQAGFEGQQRGEELRQQLEMPDAPVGVGVVQ